jgi:hypothetical protein
MDRALAGKVVFNILIHDRPADFFIRVQFLMAASIKKTSFWDVAPCKLFEIDVPHRPDVGTSTHV